MKNLRINFSNTSPNSLKMFGNGNILVYEETPHLQILFKIRKYTQWTTPVVNLIFWKEYMEAFSRTENLVQTAISKPLLMLQIPCYIKIGDKWILRRKEIFLTFLRKSYKRLDQNRWYDIEAFQCLCFGLQTKPVNFKFLTNDLGFQLSWQGITKGV